MNVKTINQVSIYKIQIGAGPDMCKFFIPPYGKKRRHY